MQLFAKSSCVILLYSEAILQNIDMLIPPPSIKLPDIL